MSSETDRNGGEPSVLTDPETGRDIQKLTNSSFHDVHAYYDISPWDEAAERIVFSSGDPDDLVTNRTPTQMAERYYEGSSGGRRSDSGAIYVMNADGTKKRRLGDSLPFSTHNGCFPMWVPGEEKIVYHRGGLGEQTDLYLLDLKRDERTVVPDFSPRQVDPGGERVIGSNAEGVIVLHLDSFDQEVILTPEDVIGVSEYEPGELFDPTTTANLKWSPDGTQIILRFSDRGGSGEVKELHIANADGSDLRRVEAATNWFHHHSWHPDGERLLFGDRTETGEGRLYFLETDDVGNAELISEEPLGGHPSVNPQDHSKIVTDSYGGEFGEGILLVDIETGEVEKLASLAGISRFAHTGFHAHPVWSPDGSQVLFNSDRDGTCDLYLLSLD